VPRTPDAGLVIMRRTTSPASLSDSRSRELSTTRSTEETTHREKMQAELAAERERAALVAEFSSALIAVTTEDGMEQVIMTRLAATFGSNGALLGLVEDDGGLLVYTDAGVSPAEADALHGLASEDSSPLREVIGTGEPLLIGGGKDYMRHWPQNTS
jgi:hypothetical protein